MRSKLELVKILRAEYCLGEKVEGYSHRYSLKHRSKILGHETSGLCGALIILKNRDLITYIEQDDLREVLIEHAVGLDLIEPYRSACYWFEGETWEELKQQRLEFLDKIINSLQNESN